MTGGGSGSRGFRPISAVIVTSAFAVIAFVAWAKWAELDQITRAKGQVIPSGRVQVVQSPDAGVVTELLVKEGDRVRRGQLLVKLDEVRERAALQEVIGKEAALRTAISRIESELFERPLEFDKDLREFPEFIENQTLLYSKRVNSLKDEIETLENMLRLIQEELQMNLPLLETGDVSRSEVLRLQRQAAETRGQIVNRRNRYLQELQTELAKAQEELVSAGQLRRQRSEQLEYTNLYAPADGIVKNVRFTTVGAVLRASDEMLQIVPTDDELIVEAKVRPEDIGFVHLGQSATVKFDAYDYSIYGSGEGEVIYISADTITEQTSRDEIAYYRAQIKVDTSGLVRRREDDIIEIQPGMTATVEIKTGKSTVYRYLSKPLFKTLSESMTER